jgi:hypothetical protein
MKMLDTMTMVKVSHSPISESVTDGLAECLPLVSQEVLLGRS